jgi:uncharacterized protein
VKSSHRQRYGALSVSLNLENRRRTSNYEVITEFNTAILGNEIADRIDSSYENCYKKRVNPAEFRTWGNNHSFQLTGLSDNKLIIEYELPYSTRRIDVLVFGRDLQKGDSVVLIELKQ